MQHLKIVPDNWVEKLENITVLRTICGFSDKMPKLASYYDFINRIVKLDEKSRFKKKKRKPSKKIGKGKKLPPKRPGIVARLVDIITAGRRFNNRPELISNRFLARFVLKCPLIWGLFHKLYQFQVMALVSQQVHHHLV